MLSGDIGQDDTTDTHGVVTSTAGIVGDNAYHVLYLDGETGASITGDTVIDGFTVTGGSATAFSEPPHDSGGGLYCAGGSGGECSPTLTNLVFSGNQAGYGGGMYNDGSGGVSSPSLSNVTFDGNEADAYGGGMYNLGQNDGVSSPTLTNVLFSGNYAGNGGGMVNSGSGAGSVSSPSLTNVTFGGNWANSGGAVFNQSVGGVSSPVIVNTILWGNRAPQIYNIGSVAPVFSYSLVQGGCPAGATCGTDDMLYVDPLFVQPVAAASAPTTEGDYRLQLASPAIDAGNTLSVTAATDLDGNPRIVNHKVDMGAYETPMPVLQLAKQAAPTSAPYGGAVTYTLVLSNTGTLTDTAALTDTLSPGVSFGAWIENPGAAVVGNQIGWSGEMAPSSVLTFSFTASQSAPAGALVTNTAVFSGLAQAGQASATFASVKAGTTTTLSSSPNPSALGQAATFTATVRAVAPGAGTPTGVVTFTVDGVDFPVALVNGVATYSTGSLSVGEHGVSATYGGDGNFLPSESQPVTQSVVALTLAMHTVGQGAVTVDPQQDVYTYGTAVTLTAQPAAGWTLAGWSGAFFAQANLVPNPITLTIAENTSVTATFEALTYTLSLAADPPQGGTVSGAGVYTHGAQAEASAAPAPGWLFVEWRENGARVSGDALYQFAMTGDRALTAHFRETTGEETGQQPAPHRVLLPVVIGGAP